MSENSADPVHSICVSMIMSTLTLVLRTSSYAHFAWLIRFAFLYQITFVGLDRCVRPVNTLRPSAGVSTMNGRSPLPQYDVSSPWLVWRFVSAL